MTDPSYAVKAEFVTGSFTDITADVTRFTVAREVADLINPFSTGTGDIMLENATGKYSPSNPSGPFAGLLRPNLAITIDATHSGSTYALFNGKVDEFSFNPDPKGGMQMTLRCRDKFKDMQDQRISTPIFSNINVGSLFIDVMSYAGFSGANITVVPMNETIPFAWFSDRNASGVLQEILESGFYHANMNPNGVLEIHDHYWDQEQTVSSSFEGFYDFNYTLNDDEVLNNIGVEGDGRVVATSVATLAWVSIAATLPASAGIGFFLQYLDPSNLEPTPATSMISPTSGTDFTANTLADGSGSDITSTLSVSVTFFGASAVCSIFNGTGSDGFLTKFQIRGTPIVRQPKLSVRVKDNSSQVVYGEKSFTLTNDLIGGRQGFALDYAQFLIDRQKNAQAEIRPAIRNEWPQILGHDIGDAIHLVNTVTGVSSRFTVVGLEHEVSLDQGVVHDVRYHLDHFRDQEVLILNSSPFGELDVRRLGF